MSGMQRAARQVVRAARSLRDLAPRPVSVREAWLEHERYAGRRIATEGVVRVFEASTPGEYLTLDDGAQRIGLRGDAALLRPQIGRRVRATGVLTFKPGVGIFLDAEHLRVAG